MKIDKRLRWWQCWPWSIGNIIEMVLGGMVPFAINTALLATGALIGRYFPPALWWFVGVSGIALLCVTALFGLVLFANAMDIPYDDMNYPGS